MQATAKQRSHSENSQIEITPLTVHTGAEINGVDLSEPLSGQTIKMIRDVLLKWKVVFFRNQHLDHEQHIAFARQFGAPTSGHVVFGNNEEYPEIYPVTKHRTAFAARPPSTRSWTDWHSDVTAAINPPFGSILRGVVVPPYGSDTQWTNMVAAYEALSPTLKEFLCGLRAVHQFTLAQGGEDAEAYNKKVNDKALVSEHPVVITHPETGERALYVNSEFTKEIVGLGGRESDMLLEFLYEHCIRADFIVRFHWEPGSIAFWDNRATQHLAIRDVYATDFEREFYRVTLNGEVPIDINGEKSRSISGQPIQPVSPGSL